MVGSQSAFGETFVVVDLKPATAGGVVHLQAVLEIWQGCWSGVEETIIIGLEGVRGPVVVVVVMLYCCIAIFILERLSVRPHVLHFD